MSGYLEPETDGRCARTESLPNTRLTEVVELNSETYLEKIQRFNSLFVPEKRLSDMKRHPLGPGTPEDVAQVIVFLSSDVARWITGATLVVDGGYSAGYSS